MPMRCSETENQLRKELTPVFHLTSTLSPLLNEGNSRKNCRIYLICIFFTLAVCVMNPRKLNAGSDGMLL